MAAEEKNRDYTKWVIGALLVVVAASQVNVIRQNRNLQQRVVAANAAVKQVNFFKSKSDRTAYEASMTGRCRPFRENAATPVPPRPLDVSIYFSLGRDCMSCIEDVVGQWNDVLKSQTPKSISVRAYTDIDGTAAQIAIDRDLKPAFPVTDVDDIEQKLRTAGVTTTPVVFVSEPATGRVLMTYAPQPGEKGDRSLVERLHAVLTPCT